MKTKRDAILDTALALFAAHGYHSVGVDRVKEEAGVSKMTLYKYFPTKEALIENTLIKRDQLFRESLQRALQGQSDYLAKIKAIFAWHGAWFRHADFHGCMFIKASEEFPEHGAEIRRIAQQHKHHIQLLLQGILEEAGIQEATALARHLLIVLEGMIVNANMFSDRSCVEAGWPFVLELLERRKPAR